jgi:SecD/SecF fusion protein
MQNKGAIRLLAILLTLVCIYQLTFTFITKKTERQARVYAMGDKEKEKKFLDSISGEVVYNIGITKYTYNQCKERELNLGLDLKGGMNVILEISVVDMVESLSNFSKDSTFLKAIELAKEKQKASNKDYVTLFGESFKELDPNAKLAAIYSTLELKDRINFNSTNDDVLKVIRQETDGAINNAFNIISSRIDQFGVVQPKIQKLETAGRILVELPGVDDPERVRRILQSTANLEFWLTYENKEMYQYFLAANKKVKEIMDVEAQNTTAVNDAKPGEKVNIQSKNEKITSKDTTGGKLSLLDQLAQDTTTTDSTLASTSKMSDFPLFQLLTPSASQDGQLMDGAMVGMAHFKDTGKINNLLNNKLVRAIFPRDVRFYWSLKPSKYDKAKNKFELYAIKVTSRDGKAILGGEVVNSARQDFGQTKASAEVSMSMNVDGAKKWARITADNIGRCIAIVLDDKVCSAPRVQTEIKGGSSQITGDFSVSEAQDLANMLKSGRLPARAQIIQEAVVGPTLGKEAINDGMKSFLIAFIVIMAYMIFYYSRRAGWVADMALIANTFFVFGILASLGAVLTLPGIAGIVLTVGMAVDANVLIYERVREELHSGKGLKLAIADGFKMALSAIIDSHVTTLLTGVVLYVFGTGPIKGFASTLIIGIITSLFSSILISRLIFERQLAKNREILFSTRITEGAFKNVHIKWMEIRHYFYIVSAVIIGLGIISLFIRGLDPGTDFTGGRTYIVRFDKTVVTRDVQASVKKVIGETPEVIMFGTNNNQVRIATKYLIQDKTAAADSIADAHVYEGVKPFLGDSVTFKQFKSNHLMNFQKVGPTIAYDMKVQAVWAILFSLIMIALYIVIRFRNWPFGLGAWVSLAHDVMIVIGCYSVLYGRLPFSLEIDQSFIAAILTVVGYSITDTVVVYDRIREHRKLYPKRDQMTVIDDAINSTLSRTINTSMTVMLVLVVIFVWGGDVIRGFVFAIMIGIVVGTYSSVLVASPVVYDTLRWQERRAAKKALKTAKV